MTMITPRVGASVADGELIVEVRDAFRHYDPIRMWGDCLAIDADGGRVVLSGMVRNHSAKETAEQLAKKVKGVTGVENRLVVDLDVELAVSQALAADSRTSILFPGVLVGVVFGVVYLKGDAPSADAKKAATEVTFKVPGVASVSNELQAPPESKVAAKPPAAEKKAAGAQAAA